MRPSPSGTARCSPAARSAWRSLIRAWRTASASAASACGDEESGVTFFYCVTFHDSRKSETQQTDTRRLTRAKLTRDRLTRACRSRPR